MHTVVNHLRLSRPVPAEAFAAAEQLFPAMQELGCRGFQLLEVADDHAILVLTFDTAEAADAVAEAYGGPWVREHVAPLLTGPTERSVGRVVWSLP
jgi:hypothetical protein